MPTRARTAKPLDDDGLLKAELDYIIKTAFQANEDRARVSSFYLVAVGSVVAALFSTQWLDQNFDPRLIAWAFCALFLVLTALGTLTTLQLARLRAAWHESMRAMNQVKDYWLQRSTDKRLAGAFRWDATTLPRKFKANSVSYYQTLEVALLSGLTFGTGVYFLQRGIALSCPACDWGIPIAAGGLAILVELLIYRRGLGDEDAA